MRKIIISFALVLSAILVLPSCGGSDVELSSEMTEFTSMIKGTSEDVSAALEKFGASDEIKNDDMTMFNLESPKVTAKNGDCYTVEFKSGITNPVYEICWTEGKISKITKK